MATEYRISDGTKWKLILIAVSFDLVQLVTPGYTDTLITAIAFIIVAIIFIENGSFYLSQKKAGRMALLVLMWLGWVSELDPGWLPMITVSVIIQVYISRTADRALGETGVDLVNIARRGSAAKEISKNTTFTKKRGSKILKVASRKYGKGRRGARTAARRASQ